MRYKGAILTIKVGKGRCVDIEMVPSKGRQKAINVKNVVEFSMLIATMH
jgi:hypothetical protein